MKRIGVIGLLHESNTFIAEPTTWEHFRGNVLATGDAALAAFRGSPHEIGGFIDALQGESDVELVGILAARAMPFGTVDNACWTALMSLLETELRKSLPLDGILVAPHGATVAAGAADADGMWLGRVREWVGPEVPIVGTLDLHANVSKRMAQACDALFGYRTNPHLDQHARGHQAAGCLLNALRAGVRPQQTLVQLPLCVNIERQATAEPQGIKLWQRAEELTRANPGVLSISCLYGFPYADVEEMGAAVLVVGESPSAAIGPVARAMARFWWEMRQEFVGQLVSVQQALDAALAMRHQDSQRPVGLLEMGDNVGGGSPGDGTWIVQAWLERDLGRILTVIADPQAVTAAAATGVGNALDFAVGGRCDPVRHGPPIVDRFRVLSLSDGRFHESGTTHGGYSHFDQGPTAVLQGHRGATIVATTRRVAPLSLQQLLSQGLDLNHFDAIVIKGVHAPVAVYAPVCGHLIRVNTLGVTTADLSQLSFQNRRRPMFPFDPETRFDVT